MAKGIKTGGGSRRGKPNKRTLAKQAEFAASGLMPLDYMLQVMRDEKTTTVRRDAMASAAAPYLHPKLSSIAHTGPTGNGPVEVNHRHQVEREVDELLAGAAQPTAQE